LQTNKQANRQTNNNINYNNNFKLEALGHGKPPPEAADLQNF